MKIEYNQPLIKIMKSIPMQRRPIVLHGARSEFLIYSVAYTKREWRGGFFFLPHIIIFGKRAHDIPALILLDRFVYI